MVFHKSLSDSKSPQISRTLLSILADLNNAVIWIVLILPQISNSAILFSKSLRANSSAPTKTDITVIFLFLSFFSSQARSKYLFILSLSFIFILWSAWTRKSIDDKFIFFLEINTKSDCLIKIGWFIYISKSQRISCISFSCINFGLYIYHLLLWWNFNLLHNS